MARKRRIIAGILVLATACVVAYFAMHRKQVADSPALAQFRAYLANPSSNAHIVFTQKMTGAAAAKFDGLVTANGFELTLIDPRGSVRKSGVFEGVPWVHNVSGVEVLELYYGTPPNLQVNSNLMAGFVFGERPFFEVLNLGLVPVKPGSLVWDGNNFQATSKANLPITGSISRLNRKGLPRRLKFRVGNQPEVELHFEYGSTNVPDFLPRTIWRPLPWRMALAAGNPLASFDFEITGWTLGSTNRPNDPRSQFPKAVRLAYTNDAWMQITGATMIPIAAR